jgi:hypothetical protein
MWIVNGCGSCVEGRLNLFLAVAVVANLTVWAWLFILFNLTTWTFLLSTISTGFTLLLLFTHFQVKNSFFKLARNYNFSAFLLCQMHSVRTISNGNNEGG